MPCVRALNFLPQEIVDKIVEDIRNDLEYVEFEFEAPLSQVGSYRPPVEPLRILADCCRISRQFQNAACRHLYHTIYLTNLVDPPELSYKKKLHSSFLRWPSNLSLVKNITIIFDSWHSLRLSSGSVAGNKLEDTDHILHELMALFVQAKTPLECLCLTWNRFFNALYDGSPKWDLLDRGLRQSLMVLRCLPSLNELHIDNFEFPDSSFLVPPMAIFETQSVAIHQVTICPSPQSAQSSVILPYILIIPYAKFSRCLNELMGLTSQTFESENKITRLEKITHGWNRRPFAGELILSLYDDADWMTTWRRVSSVKHKLEYLEIEGISIKGKGTLSSRPLTKIVLLTRIMLLLPPFASEDDTEFYPNVERPWEWLGLIDVEGLTSLHTLVLACEVFDYAVEISPYAAETFLTLITSFLGRSQTSSPLQTLQLRLDLPRNNLDEEECPIM